MDPGGWYEDDHEIVANPDLWERRLLLHRAYDEAGIRRIEGGRHVQTDESDVDIGLLLFC